MTDNDGAALYSLGQPAPAALVESLAPDRVVDVPLRYLSVEAGFNIRDFTSFENMDHLDRLARSIAEHGVTSPVRVRVSGNRIVIIDGEGRIRAAWSAREAGSKKVETIPAHLDSSADDPTHRVEALVVKNTGRPLAMLEALEVVKRLLALGKTQAEVQTMLGFGRTHMQNLALLDLATPKVREFIRQGRVPPTVVVDIIRGCPDDPEVVEKSIDYAVRKVERQDARAASLAAALGDGRVTKSKIVAGHGIALTRSNLAALVATMQKLYADMTPATEYRKWRKWIAGALERVGADVEPEVDA
jgi:hypothetical protein